MASPKQRTLDVWILEANMVYREVPYVVVTDWLQQGRLLADDCVRLSGSKKWHAIKAVPALGPFLPKVEPLEAEDRAEALEPVDLGMDWRRPGEEEDEDVDMIPLIDISLVLLIFFMMTASISTGILSTIATPAAQHQLAAITQGSYWVGVDSKNRAGIKGEEGSTWYSFGKDVKEQVAPTQDFAQVTGALVKELEKADGGEVKIRLRGERSLPIETIKGVVVQLQDLEGRLNRGRTGRLTFVILGEVSEPKISGQ